MKNLVILGPTATGKTDLAVTLAKKFNGEIISADSRQIYQDMFLGVGKTEGVWKEVAGEKKFIYQDIPHYLIDFISPQDNYNVSHFKKDCQRLIQDIRSRGKLPIICGGTGFWILSVVDNLNFPLVKPDPRLRKKLEKKTTAELFVLLEKKDPIRAKKIDRQNRPRLIRALEIAQKLGKVPEVSLLPRKSSPDFLQIGLDFPKEILDLRIQQRLKKRWAAGMLEEITAFQEKYHFSWKKVQTFGLAYYWAPLFLQGKISQKEMEERTFLGEKHYARRQRTWFKRDSRIFWENDWQKVQKLIGDFLF